MCRKVVLFLRIYDCVFKLNHLIIVSIYQINHKVKSRIRIRAIVKGREGSQENIVCTSQLISLYHLSLETNISYYTAIEAVREGSLRSVNIENNFYVVRKPGNHSSAMPDGDEEVIDSSQLVSVKYFARKNNFSYRKVWHIVNDGLLPSVQIGNRLYVIDKRREPKMVT